MKTLEKEKRLRKRAIQAAVDHYHVMHGGAAPGPEGRIPYAGRVFDEEEIVHLIDASLDFWLTAGRYAERFEKSLAEFLGVRHCALVNSGSSANLLALAALTAPELGPRRIGPGDEVITVAAGFPTTIAPIVQYGAVPVFVDISLPGCNIDCTQLEKARTKKTKAVMLAHTLGNPFDVTAVRAFCDRHGLWLVEDNCDALGSRYRFKGRWRRTGGFGHVGTSSFYPPHHMTMGEGGAVYTNDRRLYGILRSLRDWGRDCWCPPGRDNTCGRRFRRQFGTLPLGYDHKYVFSHFGYNLKATDLQAAVGCAQLKKLPAFIAARKRNWHALREGLDDCRDRFLLPEAAENSDPSWFGFLLTVREEAGFSRDAIVGHLERRGIQTRALFAGNMTRHPCFDDLRRKGAGYRVVGKLGTTDLIMRQSFWVGVYPGLTGDMIARMIHHLRTFSPDKGAP
jgi:CDP-6-deoxy-D-xylo-4-hexulose-3-dehydrase